MMALHELAHQPSPVLVAVQFLENRKHVREQALQVVEKQLAVDRHAAVLDALRRRCSRIADVGGKRVLLFLELGTLSHWQPLPVRPAAAIP